MCQVGLVKFVSMFIVHVHSHSQVKSSQVVSIQVNSHKLDRRISPEITADTAGGSPVDTHDLNLPDPEEEDLPDRAEKDPGGNDLPDP